MTGGRATAVVLPNESAARERIQQVFGKQFETMNSLAAIVIEMLSEANWEVPRRGLTKGVVQTTAALLAKAVKTFRAVQLLCASGLGAEAKVQNRSLFEAVMPLLYILQRSSRQRGALYHASRLTAIETMLNKWQLTPGLKRGATKATRKAVRTLLDSWCARAGLPAGTRVKHWSGLHGGLEEAASRLPGGAKWYQTAYRSMSPFAHGGGLEELLDAEAERIELRLEPDESMVEAEMAVAHALLAVAAHRVNERFKLGYEAKLNFVTRLPKERE